MTTGAVQPSVDARPLAGVRVLLVQYAGDYRAYYQQVQDAAGATYHGHAYVFEKFEQIIAAGGSVGVVTGLSGEAFDEVLPDGVHVMGANAHPLRQFWRVLAVIHRWRPTHVVVQGPMTPLIHYCLLKRYRTIAVQAGSFESPWTERLIKYQDLAWVLNRPGVEWVGNHGINASKSLARTGVRSDKIIPWDWPYSRSPQQVEPCWLDQTGPIRLVYAGLVTVDKGVGDIIDGVAELVRRGRDVHLDIIGGGDTEFFQTRIEELALADRVQLLGLKPNGEVFERMRSATAVVVSSRKSYPEGLPLTIYEALSSRTPVVASDHPMFRGHLIEGETARVYRGGDAVSLADAVERMVADPEAYHRMSVGSAQAWERMQNPTKWGDLLLHWLADTDADRTWLAARTLARVGTDGVAFAPVADLDA